MNKEQQIAVIIPCYNEMATIFDVVKSFRKVITDADIYVIDNGSDDETAKCALQAGATILKENLRGKGHAVRRGFDIIEADIYVIVDGDATYPAEELPFLMEPVLEGYADMVVGTRLTNFEKKSFRRLHKVGNSLITGLINHLFHLKLTDILSGYRVFSRRFVKTVPLISKGFEVETELTLLAADGDFSIMEVPIKYRQRPEGSVSKLDTWKDGFKILRTIFNILRDYRPMAFFSIIAILFMLAGLSIGIPVIIEFAETGYISKIPSAILASGLEILACQMVGVGLTLDTIARMRRMYQATIKKNVK